MTEMHAATRRRSWILAFCAVVTGLLLIVSLALFWLYSSAQPVDALARVRALPLYPGALSVTVKQDLTRGKHAGTLSFQANAGAADIQAFYAGRLAQEGWHTAGRQSDGGGGDYTKQEGSFEGIEFLTGKGSAFPWLRIKRNPAAVWLHIDVTGTGTNSWKSEVSIELTTP